VSVETDVVRILVVVEDEPDMRLMIRSILTSDRRIKIVGEAANAKDAIAVASSYNPGLIILDHQIEGDVMGLEAAPLLKRVAPLAKILLFSAFDMAKDAEAEPAVDRFLSKSNVRHLLPTVKDMLGLD
jgi:DNA-binding NarL/FixJ family response regulator